ALIDSFAPSRLDGETDDASLLLGFARDLGLLFDRRDLSFEDFDGLRPEEQLGRMLEYGRQFGFVPPHVGLEQVESLVNTYKANARAARAYEPRPYGGRVTLLKAASGTAGGAEEDTHGWGEYAAGGLLVQEIPGDHYGIMREPNVRVLSERLKAA